MVDVSCYLQSHLACKESGYADQLPCSEKTWEQDVLLLMNILIFDVISSDSA